ncbi:MAG: DUF2157 domain-containing protein [Kiritimatiellae bacterium]|nr:DUF2157 domain-containing protein [Kiritimatiellia bacterium]
MNKKEWIRNEIAMWQSAGLINADTAEKLSSLYSSDKPKISWGVMVIGFFSALLIGLGIISFFAANWDNLSRAERAVVSILPVVVCGITCTVAAYKKWESQFFWNPLGVLWMIATVSASCIVAQTYNIGGSASSLVLFTALLSLPIVFITKSVAAMSLWPLFAIVWSISYQSENGASWALLFKTVLFIVATLPAFILFLRRKPERASLVAGLSIMGIFYSVGAASIVNTSIVDLKFFTHDYMADFTIGVFWFFSLLVLLAAKIFKLPIWSSLALIVFSFVSMLTVGFDHLYMYILSIVFGIILVVYGILKTKLFNMNVGASLLLFLILVKFFESDVDFTVKGIVLVISGVLLAVMNILMVQLKKKRRG